MAQKVHFTQKLGILKCRITQTSLFSVSFALSLSVCLWTRPKTNQQQQQQYTPMKWLSSRDRSLCCAVLCCLLYTLLRATYRQVSLIFVPFLLFSSSFHFLSFMCVLFLIATWFGCNCFNKRIHIDVHHFSL